MQFFPKNRLTYTNFYLNKLSVNPSLETSYNFPVNNNHTQSFLPCADAILSLFVVLKFQILSQSNPSAKPSQEMSYNLFLDSDRTRSFLLYANTIGYWHIAVLVILAVLVERNLFTKEPIYETQCRNISQPCLR